MKRYIKILLGHKRPLRFLLARGLAESGLCRLFKIRQNGYRLHFHPTNLSEQLWIDTECRRDALQFFKAYLKPGDCVIDVGANIGDTALTSSVCVGSDGAVWAVEAHPRTFHFLEENLRLNRIDNVITLNCAVGETTGDVVFTDDRRDDMNRVGIGTITVPMRQLDKLISYREHIALLKVDVEGYEMPVLAGALEILEWVDCVHFEISRKHFEWYSYTIHDLLLLLQKMNFELYSIPQNGLFKKAGVNYETEFVENLVATRNPYDLAVRTNWTIER